MAFNLPAPIALHDQTADDNVGTIGSSLQLRSKSGGNLPVNNSASRVGYSATSSATGPAEGPMFGTGGQTVKTTIDVTSEPRLLIWSMQFNAPNRIQVSDHANGGVRMWIGSGNSPTSNYKEFFVGGNDTPFAASQAGPVTLCIDLSDTSNENTIGVFEPSEVKAYGMAVVRFNMVSNQVGDLFFQRAFLLETTKGAAGLPTFTGTSSFDDANNLLQGTDYTDKIGNWITKAGSSFFIPCPFSFGDGTTTTAFNDNGVSVISPASNATGQENFRVSDNALRVYLDTNNTANDSVTLSGSYNWGSPAPWDFSQANPLATCTLSGSYSGMGDFTLGSSVTATGTFDLATGSVVSSHSATIDGITVKSDLTLASGNTTRTYNNIIVDGVLNFKQAGDYFINDSTINTINNDSGGVVKLTISGTTITTNNGGITVQQAPRTLTLTGLQANSEVRVYTANTTTEIAGIEDSATTFSDSTIFETSVDIVVHNIAYEYLKIEGVNTSNSVILPIQQRFDRGYANG